MRILLDTCAVIDLITDSDSLDKGFERDYGIEFLPLRRDSAFVYSRLRLNLQQDHKDPSDHVIISHAIAEHLTLLSSDTRFWFYRNQGLELIEY